MGSDSEDKSTVVDVTSSTENTGHREPLEAEKRITINDLPRETIINTAAKFLSNPRVQFTALEQKQSFLRQKGLTEQEIQEACRRASLITPTSNNEQLQMQQISLPPAPIPYPGAMCQKSEFPLWFKLKEIGNVVALLSIGSYGLYSLWKSHIAPWLFGTTSKSDQQNRALLSAISTLTTSVAELRVLISNLESRLQVQSKLKAAEESERRPQRDSALDEVRLELSSIKALLLSRTQFPSSPGIPSWQLVEKEGTSREDSRDHSPHPNEEQGVGNRKEEECRSGRKQSSSGSHESIALHSDASSCEVVIIGGKQDSDHSDD